MESPSRAGGTARAVRPAFRSLILLIAGLTALHIAGLGLFTGGFLLQRLELASHADCTSKKIVDDLPMPPKGAAEGNIEALYAWENILQETECTLKPRFSKAVVWIIDALRYDFLISPTNSSLADEYMHGHFPTPQRLASQDDATAFLSHFLADAPTTTLQRLKGLTTGSLPTFIEAGANFGGAGQVKEDNWIAQYRNRILRERQLDANATSGAGMTFVGDDTWDMVFSSLFDDGRSWAYSSFNVEDLDSVDAGVEKHMLDQIKDTDTSLLIAHSLGVDHVGHRFGPSHARMTPKLEQMDRLVGRVIDMLDDDTLFVLLGDHGMDATGDHGGDSELEVGAGLFMYAKKGFYPGALAEQSDINSVLDDTAYVPFSPLDGKHRSVAQIDLVPTLSLLLGLPIPYNNLGTVIPELFASHSTPLGALDATLLRALRINARQIHTYTLDYATHATDLNAFRPELDRLWYEALQLDAQYVELSKSSRLSTKARAELQESARKAAKAYTLYTRRAVVHARSVWAQFADSKIIAGLLVLMGSIGVSIVLYRQSALGSNQLSVVQLYEDIELPTLYGTAIGFAIGILILGLNQTISLPLRSFDAIVFFSAIGAEIGIFAASFVRKQKRLASKTPMMTFAAVVILAVHAALFASNSFTMWEDRITLALLALVLVSRAIIGYSAPTTRLQLQMPLLAVVALVFVRIAAMSRVCREEQAPYCAPSFYARITRTDGKFADNPAYAYAGPATNSPWVSGLAYILALAVPEMLRRMLTTSQSQHGSAGTILTWIIRPALMIGSGYWLADWAHGLESMDESTRASMLPFKQYAGLTTLLLVGVIGVLFWIWAPLPISVRHQLDHVSILGFGNAFGSSMLMWTTLWYALLFLLAQPMGQVALTLCFLALTILAELGDNERDVRLIRSALLREAAKQPIEPEPVLPTLLDSVTIALVGWVAFFATGHQATFSTIQWRIAFVGFQTVTHPWSPLFVILNAFGPLSVLPAFALVLSVLWNVAPHRMRAENKPAPPMTLASSLLRATMGFLLTHSVLTFSSAAFACYFRRHLMLFKIWVPRFMTGALGLLLADLAILLAIGTAWHISTKVHRVFGSQFT
ncbi:mannose-ethanolamine phosphotransferase gpi13 [Malassezia yamatoensis]|uniref:Mannose-ethanolamine phosphotransferase gpi13 n=1 Tax=Malassezia yamatoensis TaxID=253288 RepID=A0AAJ6CFU7_9BASI|nr:mannose-ethanolamine phosphotransferase gpi13 [Malassezia yamatoensis]